MSMRCVRTACCFALWALLNSGISLHAADPEKIAAQFFTPAARQASQRALRFLAQRQTEEGSFSRGPNIDGRNVGVCGLAGLAFMSSGSTPGRGPYGVNINRCVDYLLANARENGFICNRESSSHGPMYGHGFAMLFLAEVYGMSPRVDLRDHLARGVKLILDTQNDQGGWRYQPQRRDADLSVTICQVMALRAAKNSGMFVPNESIERCVAYVKQSQNADGGFMYTLDGGGPSDFPRSAAGIVALYSAGIYEGDEIERGLGYLMRFRPLEPSRLNQAHFYYGHYYAVQAMWHAGDGYWESWYPAIRDLLIANQTESGSWINSTCPEYGTAMAAIVLQLPNNCLPILQR